MSLNLAGLVSMELDGMRIDGVGWDDVWMAWYLGCNDVWNACYG